jgi:hypothetical protein
VRQSRLGKPTPTTPAPTAVCTAIAHLMICSHRLSDLGLSIRPGEAEASAVV